MCGLQNGFLLLAVALAWPEQLQLLRRSSAFQVPPQPPRGRTLRTSDEPPALLDRRAVLGGALAGGSLALPQPARAAQSFEDFMKAKAKQQPSAPVKRTVESLQSDLLLVLRVQEACAQETRLVTTGKYKELQRLNIKRAVKFLLDNYELENRVARATQLIPAEQQSEALQFGNRAVESLQQILDYFPDKLSADQLSAEQKQFVLSALKSASSSIDSFMGVMPAETVKKARDQLRQENELNQQEAEEVEVEIVNANPTPQPTPQPTPLPTPELSEAAAPSPSEAAAAAPAADAATVAQLRQQLLEQQQQIEALKGGK